jgi:hypothetical protein
VIITVSVVAHRVSATPLSALYGRAVMRDTHQEERESTAAGLFGRPTRETPRIDPDELARRPAGEESPIVLDVHTR